jgi:multiple inositol-polyphosphate phosphatase/2,3-bisphosphoglycerate 3-phosphatase
LLVQEKIVKPHLKHDYNMICKIKPPVGREEPATFGSKVSGFFTGLLSQRGYRVASAESVKTEL